MKTVFYLAVFVGLLSCKHGEGDQFSAGSSQGEFPVAIKEASGLVSSWKNKGYLWTHNDSGNPAELFLVDSKGTIKLTCRLKGIRNRDWEDITIGPGNGSESYLYVGDIGDNEARYEFKYIYRLIEPDLGAGADQLIEMVDTLVVSLPDGKLDAEAMAIDPITGDLFLFSKREQNNHVYRIEASALVSGDTISAAKLGTIPYFNLVAADISLDGKEVLAKTYAEVLYWKVNEEETVARVFTRKPIILKYEPEPQGESIAWALDGSGYYTVSERREKEIPKLLFYQRVKP
jgi:hypothetical protein